MNHAILSRPDTKMLRYALYARFSTILQNPRSVDDQLQLCRQCIEEIGASVTAEFSDAAATGATMHGRTGLQALLALASKGLVDIVCAEALDRISRIQADMARIFEQFQYNGVQLITLEEGEITAMHIGVKGMMNQAVRENLAAKTVRGQIACVHDGRAGGGLGYGYVTANRIGADGQAIRGLRAIDPGQAETVRRIFRLYADGLSPRRIAVLLNDEDPRAALPLSHLTACGRCGGRMAVVNQRRYGCIRRRESGTCDMSRRIAVDELEEQALLRLREWVGTNLDWRAALAEAATAIAARRAHLKADIEEQRLRIANLLEAIELGSAAASLNRRLVKLEQDLAGAELERDTLTPPPATAPADFDFVVENQGSLDPRYGVARDAPVHVSACAQREIKPGRAPAMPPSAASSPPFTPIPLSPASPCIDAQASTPCWMTPRPGSSTRPSIASTFTRTQSPARPPSPSCPPANTL